MTSIISRKVFIIGLDGASFRLMRPWLIGGELPNLSSLVEEGASADLRSTVPPLTPCAWVSLMTGKNPGKHGIYDFYKKTQGYKLRPVNATDIDSETLWSKINKAGGKTIVINVPMTYPAAKVDGVMISGLLTPPGVSRQGGSFHPPELERKLLENVGGYRLEPEEIWGKDTDAWLKDLYDVTERQFKTTTYLLRNHDWDFFMVVFQGTDWITHNFWRFFDPNHPEYDPKLSRKYGGEILAFYKTIDSLIGAIEKELNENTTLIIMSDHGHGPLYKVIHINNLMGNLGLLRLKERSIRNPLRLDFWLSKLRLRKDQVWNLLSKYPVIMRLIREVWYRHSSSIELSLSDVDWSRTKVYGSGHMGQLRLNVKDRESRGIVKSEEYDELINRLKKELYRLRDPITNERVVERVFRREEIYSGKYVKEAPDLLYLTNCPYVPYNGIEINTGRLITPSPSIQSSMHTMDGILIMKGPGIRKGVRLEKASIMDIFPTVLHIMGIPIPSELDGDVLINAFSEDSPLSRREIPFQVPEDYARSDRYALSKEEEEKIMERLRQLGYMG